MRRLSTLFLAVFLAVLGGLSVVVAWKVMARRAAPPPAERPPQAEYQIQEVHINETLDGNLRWTLDADQAEVYDQRGVTVMRTVVIRLFSREGDWTVTSTEGTLDNARRDVSLSGDVVVRSSGGLELRTPSLAWVNEARVLRTDEPVTIRQAGTTVTGRGLEVRMQDETAEVARNVRVVITDRARSNLSLFPRSKS
jgi:LPS export ABC transporter protein LptC